jgi:hypothetical protein
MVFLKNINRITFKKIKSNGEIQNLIDLNRQFITDTDQDEYLRFMNYFKEASHLQLMDIKMDIFKFNLKSMTL